MAVTTILTHDVANYDEWRVGFDAGEPMRAQAGLTIQSVHRDVDNPNRITVIGESPSAEQAKSFLSNPNLQAAMEKAGVSNPSFSIVEKA